MPSDETIFLDPKEFIPSRKELGLDELGLHIVGEPEWGDAEHELFLIRQMRGEIPADRHPPNRTVSLKLKAEGLSGKSLAESLQRLEMKVGTIREAGGWIRRDFDPGGGFKTSVAFPCHTAVLGGVSGWLMAHRAIASEITLVLTLGPYCYGTKELETEEFITAPEKRQLVYKVDKYVGSAPGIKRVTVKNLNATKQLRGLIAAWETADYSAAPTAELAYECEILKPQSGIPAGRTGSSATSVIRTTLSSFWKVMFSSEIVGVGHMTHVGNRRLFMRGYDSSSAENAEKVEVRIEWRALGSTKWTINRPVKVPVVGNFAILDLGTCRPERAVLGDQRWEFRVSGRYGGTGITEYDSDIVWPVPAEQMLSVKESTLIVTPTIYKGWDEFDQNTGGNFNAVAMPGGFGNWATGGSAKGDFISSAGYLKRETKEDGAEERWARSPAAAASIVGAQMSFSWSNLPTAVGDQIQSGLQWGSFSQAMRAVALGPELSGTIPFPRLLFFNKVYEYTWKPQTQYTFTMLVVAGKYAMGWITNNKDFPTGPPDFVNTSVGAVAQQMRVADFHTGTSTLQRIYANFSQWEPDLNALVWANRLIELRSDGVYRQDATADVWGRLVPDGFLPTVTPSGLEERPTRGILIPTQGDFDNLPDEEDNKLGVKEKYFPGYHFTGEAV